MRVYPAYPTVVLYVFRAGSVPQAPDMYPLEVIDGEDTSPFMDSGKEDFSSTQDLESSSDQQPGHMTNISTPGPVDGDVHALAYFFALPKGNLPYGKIDPSTVKFRMFSLCKNRRAEHNSTYHFAGVPGVDIKRPAEFLQRFSTMVLRSLQSLKTELRDLSTRLGGDEVDYVQITTLLQSDLGLLSADDVEPLVDKMIAYLQDLEFPSSTEQDHDGNDNKDRFALSNYDIAVASSYLEPCPGRLQGAAVHQNMMRVYDAAGLEQWVCPGCYRHLYPSHSTEDFADHIGNQGEYDRQLGRITLRPQDSKELQKLCILDVTKIGCVSELIVETEWDTTTEDIESIHALAVELGFTRLTITTTTTSGSESAVDHPSQLPLPEESPRSTIINSERIFSGLADGLTHLTVVFDELLDLPTIFLDLVGLSPTKAFLVLKITDPSSSCTVGVHDKGVQLLELEAGLADISRILSTTKFDGDLQSITITDLVPELTEKGLLSRTNTIKTILRNNPNLPSLVLRWPANDFPKAETMMESICAELSSEQAPDSQFLTYTLIDNTDDNLSVTFLLPSSRLTKSILANVTVRNHGPNLDNFLDTYGPFIRILNTNDKFDSSCFDTLHNSIGRENSSQLTNVTICLSTLNMESARQLQSTLSVSKATLRQAVLVGSPSNDEVGSAVLSMLERLDLVQVVIFQDELDMETWITQVQESLPSNSCLTVLDRIEDFRRIIPGHDETSLGWLRFRQAIQAIDAIHLEITAASPLIEASEQDPEQDGLRKEHFATSTQVSDYPLHLSSEVVVYREPIIDSRGVIVAKDTSTSMMIEGIGREASSSFEAQTIAARFDLDTLIQHHQRKIAELKSQLQEDVHQTPLQLQYSNQLIQQNTQHIQQHIQYGKQEILLRLCFFQQQVQSIQRQNYEPFESTTPRVFIILPMKEQGRFVKKFKIYFLCECDDHQGWTHRGDSQVHIANHGGYELERPTEFFRKYGMQVAKFMNFLKYAIMAAEVGVPVLAETGFLEGLDNTSRLVRDISEDLVDKVDFAIDHLEDIGEHAITTSSDHRRSQDVIGQDILSTAKPLTGSEIRQLQTFLRVKGGDNVYANLHKIVTPEGDVRWVCAHHRQEAERHRSIATLDEFLERVGGHFDKDTGVLVVFLSTRQDARELYCCIRKFKYIHQLTVSFEWEIQESDLFELRDAIAASSIRHLDLDGERYNGSWDPVLTIMAIPKLQVLSVKKFRGFLQNATWQSKHVQLRSLDFSDQSVTNATVQKLIEACPFLDTLTLSTTDIRSTFDNIHRTAEQHGNLATLTLKQSISSRPSNADMPSVTYYFDKRQRTILSATLILRTHFYGNLIQLPMIKKEMETFEYQCHFNHFRDLFIAIKEQHLAIKEQRYQISALRHVGLVDEHGSLLISQNIQDDTATRYNYELASRLVQDGVSDPREGIRRDQVGTDKGTIGSTRLHQEMTHRVRAYGAGNYGPLPIMSVPVAAAQPIYPAIPLMSLPVPVPSPHLQAHISRRSLLSHSEDGSRMKTMVFDTSLTYRYVQEIYNSICARGHSALERLVWDITDLNDVRILKVILAILDTTQKINRSRKPATEVKIRLEPGLCNLVRGGGGGGRMGEGNIKKFSQPGLSSLLGSDDKSFLCILFTMHVTRLELFGQDLDKFLPRLCESYEWTMSELRELVVDGKSNHLNKTSLDYLQDIASRGPDVSTPGTKTLKPAQPLQGLIIQNMRLFDIQWSQLLTSLDWLTLRQISF
ncbi:hypothetical protein BGZ90_006556, partial [Linnemannia elongata]